MFINTKVALPFLGKTSVQISGENRPKMSRPTGPKMSKKSRKKNPSRACFAAFGWFVPSAVLRTRQMSAVGAKSATTARGSVKLRIGSSTSAHARARSRFSCPLRRVRLGLRALSVTRRSGPNACVRTDRRAGCASRAKVVNCCVGAHAAAAPATFMPRASLSSTNVARSGRMSARRAISASSAPSS